MFEKRLLPAEMQCVLQPVVPYNLLITMEHSTIFIELKSMIEKNWLQKSLSEFDQMLSQLEEEGQISEEEHRALLEFYVRKLK